MTKYKKGDVVLVDGVKYVLGDPIDLLASNLEIGESYIEHTGIKPDRFDIWKKDYDTTSVENSWKIQK